MCGNYERAPQDNKSTSPLFGRLGGVITSGYWHETAGKRERVCVCVCIFTLTFSILSSFFPCHPSLQLQFYFSINFSTPPITLTLSTSPLLFNSSPPSLSSSLLSLTSPTPLFSTSLLSSIIITPTLSHSSSFHLSHSS